MLTNNGNSKRRRLILRRTRIVFPGCVIIVVGLHCSIALCPFPVGDEPREELFSQNFAFNLTTLGRPARNCHLCLNDLCLPVRCPIIDLCLRFVTVRSGSIRPLPEPIARARPSHFCKPLQSLIATPRLPPPWEKAAERGRPMST